MHSGEHGERSGEEVPVAFTGVITTGGCKTIKPQTLGFFCGVLTVLVVVVRGKEGWGEVLNVRGEGATKIEQGGGWVSKVWSFCDNVIVIIEYCLSKLGI